MIVLGIETSTRFSSVALASEEGPIASMLVRQTRGHVEFLVPAIRELFARADVEPGRLAGIAVGAGPGMFTSMRVGIATGKTMAQALGVPMVAIPSLDILAFGVRFTSKLICACADARRGEVYAALYRPVPGGVQRETEYEAWSADALAGELVARGEETILVGDGAPAYREALANVGAEEATGDVAYPSAAGLVELAIPRFMREETQHWSVVEPLYVRKTDAEIKWEQRGVVIERPFRVQVKDR